MPQAVSAKGCLWLDWGKVSRSLSHFPGPIVQTKPKFYSFDDYLAYDNGAENFYELFIRMQTMESTPTSLFLYPAQLQTQDFRPLT